MRVARSMPSVHEGGSLAGKVSLSVLSITSSLIILDPPHSLRRLTGCYATARLLLHIKINLHWFHKRDQNNCKCGNKRDRQIAVGIRQCVGL